MNTDNVKVNNLRQQRHSTNVKIVHVLNKSNAFVHFTIESAANSKFNNVPIQCSIQSHNHINKTTNTETAQPSAEPEMDTGHFFGPGSDPTHKRPTRDLTHHHRHHRQPWAQCPLVSDAILTIAALNLTNFCMKLENRS